MLHDLINIVTNRFFEMLLILLDQVMVIWEWLAEITPSGWSAIASFITAFATISIVYANYRTIKKMEEDIEDRNRPFIIMYVNVRCTFNDSIYMLSIENIGRSSAENVELNLDKDFFQFAQTTSLKELTVFGGVPFNLPPKSNLNFFLATTEHIFGPEANHELCPDFKIEAKYTYKGNEYRETTVFDLGIYEDSHSLNTNIGLTLKEIRDSINKLVDKVSTPKEPPITSPSSK